MEEVVGRNYLMGEALGAATDEFVKEYFTSGFAKFRLRNFGIMQSVEEGYVLNIVGDCRGLFKGGLFKGFVIIANCWVESVIGDLGTDEWVDPY